MALVKRTRGDGGVTWGVMVYDPTTKKTVWAGSRRTKSEAKLLEATWQPPLQSTSFAGFADEWIATRKQVRPTTLANYTSRLEVAKFYFLGKDIADITTRDVEAFIANLSERYAPLSANETFSVFRRVMKAAKRFDLLDVNPTDDVSNKPRRKRQHDIQPLTKEQYHAFVAAAPAFYQPLFALWPLVGLRRGEMLGLRWEDIRDGEIHVTQQLVQGELRPLKTESSRRVIPLTPTAQEWVEKQREQWLWNTRGLVFTTEQGYGLWSTMLTIFHDAIKAAGIGGRFRLHDLRHTYATNLLHAGVNVRTVAYLLGHAQPSMTLDTYAHLLPSSSQEAADKLEEWLA